MFSFVWIIFVFYGMTSWVHEILRTMLTVVEFSRGASLGLAGGKSSWRVTPVLLLQEMKGPIPTYIIIMDRMSLVYS